MHNGPLVNRNSHVFSRVSDEFQVNHECLVEFMSLDTNCPKGTVIL